MIKHITENNCFGCFACESICPKSAIKIDSKTGFYKPDVDSSLCIECGLCLNICPKEQNEKNGIDNQVAYAIKHKEKSVLNESTSGGAFSSIANRVIEMNGVVYGCITSRNEVRHTRTESDYSEMRGSKYVQSNLSDIHNQIANDLKNGRMVLFTGTPCQCSSMKKFVKQKNLPEDMLLLVDFICHGTPSPKIFSDYISYCESKAEKNIKKHLFRPKINGWTKHTEANVLTDGTVDYQSYESQMYKSIFYSHLAMNETCFSCPFASVERVSDVTMADFWGVQKSHPEFFDNRGLSFALANTKKGRDFVLGCMDIDITEVSVDDVDQPQLHRPCSKPDGYEKFWSVYNKRGFSYVVKKYYHGGWLYRKLSDLYHKLKIRKNHE